jgi:hypothetical protein
MPRRLRPFALLPLLALSASLAWIGTARSQDRAYPYQRQVGTRTTLQIQFGQPHHWSNIRGTNVDELPVGERSDFDMFRTGGSYYVHDNNDRWFTSTRETGDFNEMDERNVPNDFASVPREHWRHYPATWQDHNAPLSSGYSATLRLGSSTPRHWQSIDGVRAEELPVSERTQDDMFRHDGNYYVRHDGRWYTSSRENGDYDPMDERNVPTEFSDIPRDHWRNYPAQYGRDMPNMDPGPAGDGSTRRERNGDWMDGDGSFRARFRSAPRWTYVRGTRVMDLRSGERPDYDLFRYGGSYYAFRNQRWYMTQDLRMSFSPIQRRQVPREFRRIPESHWNDYPDYWSGYRDANRIESTRRRY